MKSRYLRPVAAETLHEGRTITVRIFGGQFLCEVEGRELPPFYDNIQAAVSAARDLIDQEIALKLRAQA